MAQVSTQVCKDLKFVMQFILVSWYISSCCTLVSTGLFFLSYLCGAGARQLDFPLCSDAVFRPSLSKLEHNSITVGREV